MWVRGLKHDVGRGTQLRREVAPRVGAWIETMMKSIKLVRKSVAPRVGAWIETAKAGKAEADNIVAPRVGAWIETAHTHCGKWSMLRRTPCGCVD